MATELQGTYHRLEENEMKSFSKLEPTRDVQPLSTLPHYDPPPAQLQQPHDDNVIATQPMDTPSVTVVTPQPKPNPTVMIVTIVLTAVCLVHLCWPGLVCLTPALIAAIVGYSLSDSTSAEQRQTAKAFHGIAICCNVAVVVYYILAAVAMIITLATVFGIQNAYDTYRSSFS